MLEYLKTIRYWLEYAGFRIVAAVYGILPVEMASAFSGWMWRCLAPFTYRHNRALENLRQSFPDKQPADLEIIARDMWENLGRTFAETFHLREIAGGTRIFVENPEEVEAIAAEQEGKLICSGHISNWELIGAGMVRHGLKPMSVYQTIKNPLVDAYLLRRRRFLYIGGLFPKDRHIAQQLIRGARGGAAVFMLVDTRDYFGTSVDFFGRPAPSSPFPGILVRRLGLPIYICTLVREKNVRFRFRIDRLEPDRAEDRQADITAINRSIQAEIEKIIRANPAQWMWGARRWG